MASRLTPQEEPSSAIRLSPGSPPLLATLLTPGPQFTPGSPLSSSAEPTPSTSKPVTDQEPDQSFFRAWGLRAGRKHDSGGSSASAASPLTMPTKRADLKDDHHRERSTSPLAHRRLPSSSAFSTAVAYIDESVSRMGKGYNETLLLRPSFPSRESSPSIHTQKTLGTHKRRSSVGAEPKNEYPTDAADEPRSKISYLFTTRKGKKILRLGSPRKVLSEPASSHTSTRSSPYTRGQQDSDVSDGTASSATSTITPASQPLLKKGFRALKPTSAGPLPADAPPVEGLYCRLRRQLGLKKRPLPSPSCPSPSSRTTTSAILDQTASLLRALIDEKANSQPPSKKASISTSTSNLSIAATKGRHDGLFQRGTYDSASSSLRNIFIGKPHVVTPDPEAFYTAADEQQYFRTEITSPGGPNFLPSEANRVGTPPLPESGSSSKGGRRHRGFFFDYRPPEPGEGNGHDDYVKAQAKSPGWKPFTPRPHKPSPSSSGRSPNPPSSKSRSHSDEDEDPDVWFRVKIVEPERTGTLAKFEFDVPDHLPSSPLCPRHPKHVSGGKGICVYHGRQTTEGREKMGS